MCVNADIDIPVGTRASIMSKLYYGVLNKSLECLGIERYFSIIFFLNKNNGCTQQFICNHLAVDKTAMVKVIDSLILSGHITKKVNPNDRREHFVFLTKKGFIDGARISESFGSLDREIFSDISKHDLNNFNSILARLSFKLKSMPSNDLFFNYKKTNPSLKNKRTKFIK